VVEVGKIQQMDYLVDQVVAAHMLDLLVVVEHRAKAILAVLVLEVEVIKVLVAVVAQEQ
jgi:hypothetical protein